jgi:acyl carrier protein
MNIEEIKQELKNIFVERLDMNLAEVDATDDAPLFGDEGWGIDSVDVIDIVLGVEQTFKVKIKQDEDIEKHFASLNALAGHIHDLMS